MGSGPLLHMAGYKSNLGPLTLFLAGSPSSSLTTLAYPIYITSQGSKSTTSHTVFTEIEPQRLGFSWVAQIPSTLSSTSPPLPSLITSTYPHIMPEIFAFLIIYKHIFCSCLHLIPSTHVLFHTIHNIGLLYRCNQLIQNRH